jgi:hypothetical protein
VVLNIDPSPEFIEQLFITLHFSRIRSSKCRRLRGTAPVPPMLPP